MNNRNKEILDIIIARCNELYLFKNKLSNELDEEERLIKKARLNLNGRKYTSVVDLKDIKRLITDFESVLDKSRDRQVMNDMVQNTDIDIDALLNKIKRF